MPLLLGAVAWMANKEVQASLVDIFAVKEFNNAVHRLLQSSFCLG